MITDDKHRSLEERVLHLLREEILSGVLKAGTPLIEIALAERLGVSRTPLRSALHRLAEEGLVRTGANRGAVVVGISGEDIDDIYMIRMRLEGLAARLAAERVSEEGVAHLTDLVELSEFYVSRGKIDKLRELDGEFHERIYAECNNRPLMTTLSQLHNKIKLYREISLSVPGRLE
ncbi:MAG: GntR family transcriptional regulator [Clostridia bacterium]|nr:GntR family transcriptional regulator [Clostridia bacterium]